MGERGTGTGTDIESMKFQFNECIISLTFAQRSQVVRSCGLVYSILYTEAIDSHSVSAVSAMDHSVTELTERLEKVLQESVGNGPLIEKKLRNEIRIRDLKWALKSIVTILILVSGFNFCVPIYPHIRAISRIGLIKVQYGTFEYYLNQLVSIQ